MRPTPVGRPWRIVKAGIHHEKGKSTRLKRGFTSTKRHRARHLAEFTPEGKHLLRRFYCGSKGGGSQAAMEAALIKDLTNSKSTSVEGGIIRELSQQAMTPVSFFSQDQAPEGLWCCVEDVFKRSRVSHPSLTFDFIFQLPWPPPCVAREEPKLLSCGIRLAKLDQGFQRVPQRKIRHHVRIRQIGIRMQITQSRRLNWTADMENLFFERFRQIRDQGIADFISGRPVQDQAKGALRIVLADQNDGAVKERAGQLPAIKEQLTLQRWKGLRHASLNVLARPQNCI